MPGECKNTRRSFNTQMLKSIRCLTPVSPTASSPPVSMTASEVPFTGRQPARQEDSLQVTPNRPTMTDSGVDETDRHPHDAISQGRRESALAIDTGSLQENLSTPTHFDLQGSSISGNPMFVGGNVTQVVVAQPDESEYVTTAPVSNKLTVNLRIGAHSGLACAKY
jgi:hypothetical protein